MSPVANENPFRGHIVLILHLCTSIFRYFHVRVLKIRTVLKSPIANSNEFNILAQ